MLQCKQSGLLISTRPLCSVNLACRRYLDARNRAIARVWLVNKSATLALLPIALAACVWGARSILQAFMRT